MKDMPWGTTIKGSPRMSSNPRPLSWIVVSVGILAVFLIYASWVLVSYPIGATVHGYFYGVDRTAKLYVSVTPKNEDSMDAYLNKSSDLVDSKPSSDPQYSTISSGQYSDSRIEQTDTNSNSQVDLSEPSSAKSPITKEVNGIESSDNAASNSQESTSSFENRVDAVDSSLPAQSNSQIDLISAATLPVAGNNASNVTSNVRTEELASVELTNQSNAVITTSNDTSMSSGDSTSTAVPESIEKPDNTSSADSVNSGCNCSIFTCTSLLLAYHFIYRSWFI